MSDGLKKNFITFLQKGKELEKPDPLVSYYCRLHALEIGMKASVEQKELLEIMDTLEQMKAAGVAGNNKEEDALHVEGFALSVFVRADKQDRAGQADANTAKTFMAAARFFELLSQFGEINEGVAEKRKYALWKARDITMAIKQGKKPTPGNPFEEEEQQQDPGHGLPDALDPSSQPAAGAEGDGTAATTTTTTTILPPPADLPTASVGNLSIRDAAGGAPPTSPSPIEQRPTPMPPPAGLSAPPPRQQQSQPSTGVPPVSRQDMLAAQKAARVAVSALDFDDIDSAVSMLRQALGLLTGGQ